MGQTSMTHLPSLYFCRTGSNKENECRVGWRLDDFESRP